MARFLMVLMLSSAAVVAGGVLLRRRERGRLLGQLEALRQELEPEPQPAP